MAADGQIIIKKVKKFGAAGHHGGAWKVAYADFVTAMMAFFLLMWLINTTTPEQKRGIAEYFAPAAVSQSNSGAGGVLGGKEFTEDGARFGGSNAVVNTATVIQPASRGGENQGGVTEIDAREDQTPNQSAEQDPLESEAARQESSRFAQAALSIRQALQDLPELAELSKNVLIDETPEGLRIQLVDQEGRAMFAPGDTAPNRRAARVLEEISKVVAKLPNRIAVSGHTAFGDVTAGQSPWTISALRAESARTILDRSGVDSDRFYEVTGRADSDPMFVDDPGLPGNRRISLLLMREAPVLPPGHSL